MTASGQPMNRELHPAGSQISCSPGEKAGMRADVILPENDPPGNCQPGA
jgi:hypothetical protein